MRVQPKPSIGLQRKGHGGSTDLVVMGKTPVPKGAEFKSQHLILKGHLSL